MTELETINRALDTCRFETAWAVRVELADRDDARVREAVTAAVGLRYGDYQGVAFEGATGMQFFQPLEGSVMGEQPHYDGEMWDFTRTVEMPVRVLTFSVPRDAALLARAVEAVRHSHSYEEPVITVSEVVVCRADDSNQRDNPNRWWNRGFTE
ncbi:hypothetical protein [uncultured Sulfitobacter sp.]|uniref:hypothetical protein n=1 Tax=uncultured Sulfitobacter sp. TaxID=191468 RepID=UPI00260495EA|nr:hypothetical protein [uncultured Sulfitobacter sp.]